MQIDETSYSYIVPLFVLSAIGANICYSFAYALEFLFGSNDPTSGWMRYGRTTAFVSGLVFTMFLALAQMEWHHGIKRGQQEAAVATHLAIH